MFGKYPAFFLTLGVATLFWFAAYYRLNKSKINTNIPKTIEKLEEVLLYDK